MERRVSRKQSSEKLNANYTQSLVSYFSSNVTSRPGIPRQNRWKLRSRLDNLLDSNNQQSLNIPNITIANINETHMIKQGGFAIAYYEKKNCIIYILALYYKNSNFHSFIFNHHSIDDLSYISAKELEIFYILMKI
ncbi:hypothetical protein C2G38_2224266 [Gigaspora rosea]|uniref:Uncharacterized protein n=1 Tax=Gigaspora rosea TaxID=44941 RepID=A0A397U3J6_9GLOM|nr:hypothetical protein C2G38_2224266 [Gigaspora rosea]